MGSAQTRSPLKRVDLNFLFIQELVPVLSHLGFRCIVSDDREEFTKPELFPGAEEIRLIDFGKLEETFTIHPEDYIVVVTRGHLCDTDAERFGLKTPAGYIVPCGSDCGRTLRAPR